MSKKDRLPPHEWAAVLLFIGFLFSFGLITYLKKPPPLPVSIKDLITIRVVGDVENPGYHTVPKGSVVEDLYTIVKPKFDTAPVNLLETALLVDGETVRFKSVLLKVNIKGAIREPASLRMRKGSILADYLDMLDLEPDADIEKVQNREIKRQYQTITIPRKRV